MTVLHLQFDIDSEVHPELHDMLRSISSSLSREERMRQLAATGLVWERLRLEGTAAAPSRAQDGSGDASVVGVAMAVEREEGHPEGADLTHPEHRVPEVALDEMTLDLADDVNAILALTVSDPPPLETFEREVQSAVRALPVLTDVVDPREVLALRSAASMQETAPRESGPAAANDPIPDSPIARKAVTRSRLMRMKEKGLFRNE